MSRDDTERRFREPFEFIGREELMRLPDGTRVVLDHWRRRDPLACFGPWAYRFEGEPVLVLPERLPKAAEDRLVEVLAEAIADGILADEEHKP